MFINVRAVYLEVHAVTKQISVFTTSGTDSCIFPQRQLSMPTLGIAGEGNNMLRIGLQTIAEQHQWQTIPETGHFLTKESPYEVAELMISFLNK